MLRKIFFMLITFQSYAQSVPHINISTENTFSNILKLSIFGLCCYGIYEAKNYFSLGKKTHLNTDKILISQKNLSSLTQQTLVNTQTLLENNHDQSQLLLSLNKNIDQLETYINVGGKNLLKELKNISMGIGSLLWNLKNQLNRIESKIDGKQSADVYMTTTATKWDYDDLDLSIGKLFGLCHSADNSINNKKLQLVRLALLRQEIAAHERNLEKEIKDKTKPINTIDTIDIADKKNPITAPLFISDDTTPSYWSMISRTLSTITQYH